MDKYTLDSLNRVINYIYDQEAQDFENTSGKAKENHIFHDIELVTSWVDKELAERGMI